MWLLLAGPSVGALALLGSRRVYTIWAVGAGLVFALFAVSTAVVQPMSALLAGFQVYPEDVVFGLLFVIATLRLTLGGELQARHAPWLLFSLAATISFLVGAQSYGVKPAGVEFRAIFYIIAGCLYSGSFRLSADGLRRFVTIWLWTAGLLLVLVWFRWAAEFLGLSIRSQWEGVGGMNRIRVLNASQSLFLAQAFLVSVYLYRYVSSRILLGYVSAALLGTVILLQHRSVWVALAGSCAMIAYRERAWRKFLAVGLVAAALAAPAYLLISNYAATVGESLRSSAEEPFDSSRSTIAWRTELWQQYLVEFLAGSGAQTWVGTGFGNPTSYQLDTEEVSNAAHNYFVYTLNRAGVLGLVTLLLCYATLLARTRGIKGRWDYLGLFAAITFGQLIFYMVYAPSFEQGMVSGAVLGMIANRSTAEVAHAG